MVIPWRKVMGEMAGGGKEEAIWADTASLKSWGAEPLARPWEAHEGERSKLCGLDSCVVRGPTCAG